MMNVVYLRPEKYSFNKENEHDKGQPSLPLVAVKHVDMLCFTFTLIEFDYFLVFNARENLNLTVYSFFDNSIALFCFI